MTRMPFSVNSNSVICCHVLRRWRSSRMNSKCGARMLRKGLPPPFRCVVSVITRQISTVAGNPGRERVKVKVR